MATQQRRRSQKQVYQDCLDRLNEGVSWDERQKKEQNSIRAKQYRQKTMDTYESALSLMDYYMKHYGKDTKLESYQKMFGERLQEIYNFEQHGNSLGFNVGQSKSISTQSSIWNSMTSWFGPNQQQTSSTEALKPYRNRPSTGPKIYKEPIKSIQKSPSQPQQQARRPPRSQPNVSPAKKKQKLSGKPGPKPRTKKPAGDIMKDPAFRGVDKKLLKAILDEVIDEDCHVEFDSIVGLKEAKRSIYETVVLPSLRPDLFQGIREPARGILLFGPPGTGKTLLAKAVASQCKATFFSISASSITSKYVGQSEKMVKALFAAAHYLSPSVIFFDEIDSVLTERSEDNSESSRRLKTEFLVQLDGVSSRGKDGSNDRVLLLGATNLPGEIDEAALRRFQKKIYIPLPDAAARATLISKLLSSINSSMSRHDLNQVAKATQGYSGSDLNALTKEASMECLRELSENQILSVSAAKIRPVNIADFKAALQKIKPTAKQENLQKLNHWKKKYGC